MKYWEKSYFFYRLNIIHFSIITRKENIQERELMILKYNCNSSKSVTSISFYKKLGQKFGLIIIAN